LAKKIPLNPKHPERICWGCDKYCPADSLNCGNGSGRTQHPAELLGVDWYTYGDWGIEGPATVDAPVADSPASVGMLAVDSPASGKPG